MNLGSRLSSHLVAAAAAAAALVSVAPEADAGIVYRTYNTVIPANIDGLYVNVETGVTGATGGVTPGWDINPYGATALQFFAATGTGYLRFPGSATTTVAGNLVAGTPVDATGSFAAATTAVTFGAGDCGGCIQLAEEQSHAAKGEAAKGESNLHGASPLISIKAELSGQTSAPHVGTTG